MGAPLCSLPLFFFVSAGSSTPVQACTGTHRWIVSQYLGLASCIGLHSHARRPGIKPDSSGSAPLVQVMLHHANQNGTAKEPDYHMLVWYTGSDIHSH